MEIKIRMTVRKPETADDERTLDRMVRHFYCQRLFRVSRCEIADLTDIGGDLEYTIRATVRKGVGYGLYHTEIAKDKLFRESEIFKLRHLIKDINVIEL